MQTSCPNCQNRLVVDDARVPAGPFMLKCPKCSSTIKLPGKEAAVAAQASGPELGGGSASTQTKAPSAPEAKASPAPPAASAPAPAPAPAPQAAPGASAAPVPQPPQAALGGDGAVATPPVAAGERALVAFSSQNEVTQMATTLQRLGFTVEFFDLAEERLLALKQGDYVLVACSRSDATESGKESAYQIVKRLPPDLRRRLFLILVDGELTSGDTNQAFATEADVVLHSKDVGACDRLLTLVIHERKRLFQTFWAVEDRKLTGAL